MKKIITLAVLGLAVTACDPFNSEPGGTPTVKYVTVTGASYGPIEAAEASSVWSVDAQINSATSGRMVVVTTNQLLDGSSIEAAPYELNGATGCVPANNWLAVTTAAGTAPAGGNWYTCYYPSSATASDGASVVMYYSAVAPGIAAAARPTVAGQGPAADLQYRGTVKTKDGADLPVAVNVSFGSVSVTPAPAAGATRLNVATGSTTNLGQVTGNRTAATTAWSIASAVTDAGDAVEGAARGTLSAATGATVDYVAPATLPAGAAFVQISVRAANRNAIGTRTIRITAP